MGRVPPTNFLRRTELAVAAGTGCGSRETVTPSSGKRLSNLLIVAVIWTAMLFAALGLVRTYGTRTLPQADELWVLYDAGPGIHLQWLWHTWAEHRIPLAKLIWKSVLQITGYDF